MAGYAILKAREHSARHLVSIGPHYPCCWIFFIGTVGSQTMTLRLDIILWERDLDKSRGHGEGERQTHQAVGAYVGSFVKRKGMEKRGRGRKTPASGDRN